MQSEMFNTMFAPAPRRKFSATHVLVALIVAGVVGYWGVQTFRHGKFMADASGVTIVTLTRPVDGETGVLPNAFVTANLNEGHAIDPGSLDASTVRLYRASDGKPVPAQVSTSAAGDDIVLTPIAMLDAGTKYTFEVDGVKDMAGAELMKFKMSFTTSGAGASESTYPAAFEKVDLPSETNYYTALAIGPDHRLYASTVDGKIIRRDISAADGTLGPSNTIVTVQKSNQGPRLITGIRFDPKASADHLSMWVSHGQFIVNQRGEPSLVGATEWTGKISLLSGAQLDEYRDVVVNLPRSWRDHLNNQIDFGPDGCIYFSQGSHTAMGAPDKKWGGNRVERLLSAAVLRLDPSKLSSDGQPLDVKTPDGGGTYDPFGSNAPLTIYASGVRVGYDMLWHSNGHLYTATNGSAAGGNVPATPGDHKYPRRIDADRNGPYAGPEVIGMMIPEPMPDLLLKLEPGGYYGHPNPLRGEYVMLGGNPTSGKDPYEVSAYPVGTRPDRNWRKPAYDFGVSASPNGMIEYQSGGKAFAGALDGKMMIARLNANDILVLALDAKGDPTETITGIAGLTSFTQPLDLAEDAASGCIYVAEYRGEKLALLRPINDPSRLATLHQTVFRQQVRAAPE